MNDILRPATTCVHYYVHKVHGLGKGISQVDMMKSHYRALFFSPLQSLFTLHSLFFSYLLIIKLSKIIYNDRNGQSNDQYTTNCAGRPDNFPDSRLGTDVPIPHCTHGYDGPPKCFWYASK